MRVGLILPAIVSVLVFLIAVYLLSHTSILSQEKIGSLQLGYSNGTSTTVNVYLAQTPIQWTTGMMNQSSLGNCNGLGNCYGMLFVFPNTSIQCFWMENTIMPLKQFWITNNTITAEWNGTPYSKATYCYQGNEVLETPSNSTLKSGDSVSLKQ